MKKVLLLVVLVVVVAAVGLSTACTSETPTPVHTPTPIANGQPPEDVTWLSPGKVHVGNFYPGARAEYPVTIHNGNDYRASFAVSYRMPDSVGEDYVKPTSVVQDWVMIVDPTPVLMPKETKDVLVVLMMPEDLEDEQVLFWQITLSGSLYLEEVREDLRTEFENEEGVEGKVREAILTDPTTSLLAFLQNVGTVSLEDFSKVREGDSTRVVDLEGLDYTSIGDLRESRWEFWISVKDATQTGMVQTELCSRWLIAMR